MDCSGNSAGEEAHIGLSFTFTTQDVKRTSKIHPVTSNRLVALTRHFTSGGGSGVEYGLLETFLQITHLRRSERMHCLPDGIQYCCRSAVRVAFTPQ